MDSKLYDWLNEYTKLCDDNTVVGASRAATEIAEYYHSDGKQKPQIMPSSDVLYEIAFIGSLWGLTAVQEFFATARQLGGLYPAREEVF